MPDGGVQWTKMFIKDILREGMQRFDSISRGFGPKQKENAAIIFFHGVAQGAKLARDPELEALIRGWMVAKLRPMGYLAVAHEVGIEGETCGVGRNGAVSRDDGVGTSASAGGEAVGG